MAILAQVGAEADDRITKQAPQVCQDFFFFSKTVCVQRRKNSKKNKTEEAARPTPVKASSCWQSKVQQACFETFNRVSAPHSVYEESLRLPPQEVIGFCGIMTVWSPNWAKEGMLALCVKGATRVSNL